MSWPAGECLTCHFGRPIEGPVRAREPSDPDISRARRSAKETPEATLLHHIGSLKRCEIWGTRSTRHPSIFPAPFSPFSLSFSTAFNHLYLIRTIRDSKEPRSNALLSFVRSTLHFIDRDFVNLTERRKNRWMEWMSHPRSTHVELVSPPFGPLKFLPPAIMRCCVFPKYATIKGERWKEGKHAPRISAI